MTTAPRSYGQACPLALSMDLLGERWTMLVVRELLLGPKRFGELDARLDGVGPNRLTQRLRLLQANGVVGKTEGGAYALTPAGEDLREPVIALAIWGLRLMADGKLAQARPEMVALCMTVAVDTHRLADMDLTCEIDAGEVFTVEVRNGRMRAVSGSASTVPTARLTCAPATFLALVAGSLDVDAAVRDGEVVGIDGPPGAVTELLSVFAETCRGYLGTTSISAG